MIQVADKFSVNYFKAFFEQFKSEVVKKPTDNAQTSIVIAMYFNVNPFMVVFSSLLMRMNGVSKTESQLICKPQQAEIIFSI